VSAKNKAGVAAGFAAYLVSHFEIYFAIKIQSSAFAPGFQNPSEVQSGVRKQPADKAPEGWSSPRRYASTLTAENRASVLDCGSPLPLFPGG
jgi:hypothetical protein